MSIRIDDLSFSRNSRKVLDRISLNFTAGHITALTGHNGSGKSTLLRMIAGLLKPDKGSVYYGETPVTALDLAALARKRAIVLQNPHIPENMRVNELLSLGRFACRSSKQQDLAAIEKALTDTGTAHLAERKAGTLSGGELRKVLLALALVQEAELLLLDELEANLDADFRRTFPILLDRLRRERSLTVIMVTHDLNLALHCADDIAGLQNGELTLFTSLKSAGVVEKLQKFTGENFEIFSGSDGSLQALPRFAVNFHRKE